MACVVPVTAGSEWLKEGDCSAHSSGALSTRPHWFGPKEQPVAIGQRVVIAMDPHKRSVTIEVMGADEGVLGGGRFGTDVAGFKAMCEFVRRWPDRVWAIEGCSGIGRHVAMRLIAEG